MTVAATSLPFASPRVRVRAVLAGGLTVAALDATDAMVFFGLYRDVSPLRIWQSVASGLLGPAAFDGGAAAAALGLLCHLTIATGIVATYTAVASRWPLLRERAVACGLLYGPLVYVIMEKVVVPLSRARHGSPPIPVLLNGILGHALLVGLPAALWARRALRQG